MTRIGAAAKKRQREGLPPVKPGLPSWVHGTKETFFAAMKDDFRAAKEVGRMGSFYDEAAHKYLGIYGYHTGWLEDLEEGQTVADDVDPDEDPNSVDPDEAAERAVYFKKLRGKIGVWFNGRYGAVEKKTKKVTFREVFDKPELDPPAPVKARTINFYSRRYYHERVAPTVTARWEAAKRLPNPPKLVTLRGAVTRELYAGESPAFKAEMQSSIEREHKAATDAYAMAMAADVPTTAEQFDVALNNAPYYLQPFADAIQAQYGMNVCIMMCGPVPDRGGRIEVRSIHAGMSTGVVPRIWSDYDRGGFDMVQRSFIDFSHHCFSEAECRARSLNDSNEEETVSSGDVPVPEGQGRITSSDTNNAAAEGGTGASLKSVLDPLAGLTAFGNDDGTPWFGEDGLGGGPYQMVDEDGFDLDPALFNPDPELFDFNFALYGRGPDGTGRSVEGTTYSLPPLPAPPASPAQGTGDLPATPASAPVSQPPPPFGPPPFQPPPPLEAPPLQRPPTRSQEQQQAPPPPPPAEQPRAPSPDSTRSQEQQQAPPPPPPSEQPRAPSPHSETETSQEPRPPSPQQAQVPRRPKPKPLWRGAVTEQDGQDGGNAREGEQSSKSPEGDGDGEVGVSMWDEDTSGWSKEFSSAL